MRIGVINVGRGGHHLTMLPRVLAAMASQGYEVYARLPPSLYAATERQLEALAELDRLTGIGQRITLAATAAHPRMRDRQAQAWLREQLEALLAWGADALIDLYTDRTLWAWARQGRIGNQVPRVHFLNRTRPLAMSRSPRAVASNARWAYYTSRALRLAHRVVVNSPVSQHRLTRLGVPATVLPVPCWVGEPRTAARTTPSTLGFLGALRWDKGAELLAPALARTSGWSGLLLLGDQPSPELEAAIRANGMTIESHEGLLYPEFDEAMQRADLIVLPYLGHYVKVGSLSMAVADALRAGVPMVVSPALAPALPPQYRGAVVMRDESAGALADAIAVARQDFDQLATAAATEGRAFAETALSTFDWVDALLEPLGPRPSL